MSTAAGELAALRGIARRLSTTDRPIEARQARAWGSAISQSARGLQRHVEFARAEAEDRHAAVDPFDDDGYEGLTVEQAAQRFASMAAAAAIEGLPASRLMEERVRFVRHVNALSASRSAPAGRGVARVSPDASGAGLARQDGRETAKAAALQVLPQSGRQRRKVLDAVAAVAADPTLVGLTDLQIAQATGLRDNSVRPRRVELVDGGWLQAGTDSAGKVVTREHYGREHTVWVLTQRAAGERELLDLVRRGRIGPA